MADLDELALSLPQATKELSDDRRPCYRVHGKMFILHRSRRPDAVDSDSGERMDDVLMFRVADLDVKDLLLADERGLFFTTPHFNGYPAVLIHLKRVRKKALREAIFDGWLACAPPRLTNKYVVDATE